MPYYSDEEIVTMLEETASPFIAKLVRERFEQKNRQRDFTNECLQEAANIIGHNVISECLHNG